MPKLLSRSKHEEFESNSSLQIRSEKERRAKSEEKWSIVKFGSCNTVHSSSTVHPTAIVLLHFMLFFVFVTVFGFLSFYPCNRF